MRELCAAILAAGQGKRMRSKLVKVLHPLAGEPMIRYVVDLCEGLPLKRVLVIVGYQAEKVKEALAGRNVEFVIQEKLLGTAHALLQTEEALQGFEGDLLVLSGDTPLLQEEIVQRLIKTHQEDRAAATILTAVLPDPRGYGRVVRRDGAFFKIAEEPEASSQELLIREVNVGAYCFDTKPLFPALKAVQPSPVKGEYYMPGALEVLLRQGFSVQTVPVEDPEEALGINSRADLALAHRVLRRRVLSRLMREGVTILDPETTYIDPSVQIGQDTILYPHVFLEGRTLVGEGVILYPHCRIRDSKIGNGATILDGCVIVKSEVGEGCQVGPYAHFRPESRLKKKAKVGNFVEVKKSTIGEGSKVPHLSYIGDTIMGDRVNIGAGTITCNYDGFAKHQTVIEDDVFVGSNTNLVAPVKVGKGSIIAAGSTIIQDVPPDALALARAQQVNKEGRAEETRRKRKAMAPPCLPPQRGREEE